MAILSWNIFGLSCCVLIFCIYDSNQRALRVKRQGSQMDPLLRAICAGADGTFAHPFSCGSYIQCFNQTYSEADCPGNMQFNSKLGYCDFRRKVKCRLNDDGIVDVEDPSMGPAIPVPPIDHYPLDAKHEDNEEDDTSRSTSNSKEQKKN